MALRDGWAQDDLNWLPIRLVHAETSDVNRFAIRSATRSVSKFRGTIAIRRLASLRLSSSMRVAEFYSARGAENPAASVD